MELREDVRRTNDVPIEPVEHPQWKGAHVRPMGAKALGQFKTMAAPDDSEDGRPFEVTLHIMAFLVAHSLCDKDGVRAFDDDEVDWVETNKPADLLEPIAEAVCKLHGFADDEDDDKAKN